MDSMARRQVGHRPFRCIGMAARRAFVDEQGALVDEQGFGLLETVLALTLMMIVLIMTLTPTVQAMHNLQSSRLLAVAHNLGQAEIEHIRSLEYEDVGIAGSNPGGVLVATGTTTVQGLVFTVETTVTFQGEVTGLDVIPQGGDGVEGFWDSGVNFKSAVVTVSVPGDAIPPVSFSTIVAPPNVGAHEGKSNVIVDLVKYEQVGSTLDTDWPRVSVIKGAFAVTHAGVVASEQPFLQLDPSSGTPWVARLGSTIGAVQDPVSGWRIRKLTLDALGDRVDIAATVTAGISLEIYKPVTLALVLEDGAGNPVDSDGTITVTSEAGVPATYDGTGAEDTGVGTWQFAQHGGEPMPPDRYAVRIDIPGYVPVDRDIEVPSGYPTTLAHVETFALEVQQTYPYQLTVYDRTVTAGQELAGALVNITGGGGLLTTPLTLTTGANGRVTASLPVDNASGLASYDIVVTAPAGHSTATFVASLDTANPLSFTRALTAPSNRGVINMSNLGNARWFGYRTQSGGGGYTHVEPNSSGRAAVVVAPGGWRAARLCSNNAVRNTQNLTVTANNVVNYAPSGSTPC